MWGPMSVSRGPIPIILGVENPVMLSLFYQLRNVLVVLLFHPSSCFFYQGMLPPFPILVFGFPEKKNRKKLNHMALQVHFIPFIPGHPWTPPGAPVADGRSSWRPKPWDAWCARLEVPSEAARRSFGDLSFAAEEAIGSVHFGHRWKWVWINTY